MRELEDNVREQGKMAGGGDRIRVREAVEEGTGGTFITDVREEGKKRRGLRQLPKLNIIVEANQDYPSMLSDVLKT